jgi:Mg2+-importing ATPase
MIGRMLGRFRRAGGEAAFDATSPGGVPAAFWTLALDDAFAAVGSGPDGLNGQEARARLDKTGPNLLEPARRTDDLALLLRQFESPIILILVFATVLSGLLGDATDATIILAIIVLSGLLGFWQERGATRAVEALVAVVQVKAEVRRDGRTVEVPIAGIVPGDVALLNAGDLVPGDCLIADSRALLVDEATLTGETFPVEKSVAVLPTGTPLARRTNAVFMGTHVVSGSAAVLVIRTGRETEFGKVSARLRQRPTPTSFERGMTAFGYLLLRAMVVLVVGIFVVNLLLERPLVDSALFSLALAVGLTPQLLPAIVTISLSEGARLMARQRVVVKRLDAIEDFGAMSILCTDKTGTRTSGTVRLAGALGLAGGPCAHVLGRATLNARYQTGFNNPIDAAILASGTTDDLETRRLDELPYDFSRRRLSILVAEGGSSVMITKGALESVLQVCTTAEQPDGKHSDIARMRADILGRFATLCAQGYRVLGIASRDLGSATRLAPDDESSMTFLGFLTFLDPPKAGVAATIRDLAGNGIGVRMITGDNRLVAAHVGEMVGLPKGEILTGQQVDRLSGTELDERAKAAVIFAEVEPGQKERIIRALRASGAVVGYLGDGINDAPALHAADVGISVDTAADVAKESAAIVLLEKDLGAILDGVRQGRRTFANTMKYVYTTTSANFGNMVSMAVAAAFLPFLPLLAEQILLINFLTDFPSTTIATDNVDPEQVARPHGWDIRFVRRFMIVFGVLSSIFDLLTFAILRLGFNADAVVFRSGWFLESVATELAVLFILRTRRIFFRSRPSRLLALSSLTVGLVTLGLPFSPAAPILGLTGPSPLIVLALSVITVLYVLATELAKRRFYARAPVSRQTLVARDAGAG